MKNENLIPWLYGGLILVPMSYLTLTLGHPESFIALLTSAGMIGTMLALRRRLNSITEPVRRDRVLNVMMLMALMGVITAFGAGAGMLGGHHSKRATPPTVSALR